MKIVATSRIEIPAANINIIVGQVIDNPHLAQAAMEMGFGKEVDLPGVELQPEPEPTPPPPPPPEPEPEPVVEPEPEPAPAEASAPTQDDEPS